MARSAKGRPSSHPRGRHSPSPQHILDQSQSMAPAAASHSRRLLRWSLSCLASKAWGTKEAQDYKRESSIYGGRLGAEKPDTLSRLTNPSR